jgi:hypothetical protein
MTHEIFVKPMVMLASGTGFAPIVVASAKRDFVLQGGLSEEAFYADSFTSAADQ